MFENPSPPGDVDVAVIGGGAAGIAASRRLAGHGISALLIEARPRLGGRAWTADIAGYALDMGCGWLHSADRNPWTAIAERQGRAIDKSTPPWMRRALTQSFPAEAQQQFSAAMAAFHERIDEAADGLDRPMSAQLETGNRWNGLIDAVNSYISGAETDRVSTRDFANYADTDINWRVAGGYGTAIAAEADGLAVTLDCPVRRIDHSGKTIRIETARGTITAKRVIVALPSAIVAEMEDLFFPALPEKTEAARGLPLGLADKLFMTFEGAEEFDRDTRVYGYTDRAAAAGYNFRPFGYPLIEAYFGGRCAEELEKQGDAAFFHFAREELTAAFGSAFAKRIAPLTVHRWRADPFARGSYSYAMPGKADCRAVLARPVDGRIFFAGEACSTHDFSTAHGALLTGWAAADAVAALAGK